MKSFLKYILATIIGLFLFTFLSFFLLIGIGAAASQGEQVSIDETSVLSLNFNTPIYEKEEENPFEDLNFELPGAEAQMGLKEIKECISKASRDPNIRALYLNLNNVGGGFAITSEIRKEIIAFKDSSEKPVIAYAEYLSEGAYYLATVADHLILHPYGSVEFNGFNNEMMFFKGTMEKLEIEPTVVRVGEYKSFAEPFSRKEMSEENREQMSYLLNGIYDEFLGTISESRNISVPALKDIANTHAVRLAEDALELKMVDHLMEKDELLTFMKEQIGLDSDEKIEMVGYGKYKKVDVADDNISSNRIAILVAEGEIRMGQSEDGVLGEATFRKEIKKLRENDKVKAIVIRVNSPGGSALASELMEREIQLTREVKPVIASMSDLAASGGYWISMGCDRVVSGENTITGSIGVIGLLFNVENFLKNKLGITTDKVKTGEFSDIANGTHAISEEELAIIQESVDFIYKEFTTKVASYRGLELDSVLNIAGGRVWTGKQALDRKLVDEIGTLDRAVEIAAEMAELEDYRVRYYPPKKNFLEDLMNNKAKEEMVSYLMGEPDEITQMVMKIKSIKENEGILARMPFGMTFTY